MPPLISDTNILVSTHTASPGTDFYLKVTDIFQTEADSSLYTSNIDNLIFCYDLLRRSLLAFVNKDYTKFDPLTTTNCCHGMSIFIHDSISKAMRYDISYFINLVSKNLTLLKHLTTSSFSQFEECIFPQPLIHLSQIYLLTLIKEINFEGGGWRTQISNLLDTCSLSRKMAQRLVKNLQTRFSNSIALSYETRSKSLLEDILINDIPIKLWTKYISSNYLRVDKRGRKYASCLFSMQVTIACIIQNRIKIALVHDCKRINGEIVDRYIQILEGNGIDNFNVIEEENFLNGNDKKEPIIVFSGCSYSNSLKKGSLKFRMFPWLSRFPSLILACDTQYPQFPTVSDDLEFNNSPIYPYESKLIAAIQNHVDINGVSASDPTFFCLSHIYTASAENLAKAIINPDSTSIPFAHLPQKFATTPSI